MNKGYTAKQLAIINHEVPLDQVHTTALSKLLKKAVQLGDASIDEQIRQIIKNRKQAAADRNRVRCREYQRIKRSTDDVRVLVSSWNKGRCGSEYTSLQRDIIAGTVPYEQVTTQALSALYRKALSLSDNETAEIVMTLYAMRVSDWNERRKESNRLREQDRQAKRKLLTGHTHIHVINVAKRCRYRLTNWEKSLLNCEFDSDNISTQRLERILDIALIEGDEY